MPASSLSAAFPMVDSHNRRWALGAASSGKGDYPSVRGHPVGVMLAITVHEALMVHAFRDSR